MKRCLLFGIVATTIATMLVGCNISVNLGSETPSSEEIFETESELEEVLVYNEVFYEEPNWEEKYPNKSENFIEDKKREYNAMKFVFEDMTQKFKNKEKLTATEAIYLYTSEVGTSFTCNVCDIVPDDSESNSGIKVVYDRESYNVFGGFDVEKTDATAWLNDTDVKVSILANIVEGRDEAPMRVNVVLQCNEDGTYTYKNVYIMYYLYDIIEP